MTPYCSLQSLYRISVLAICYASIYHYCRHKEDITEDSLSQARVFVIAAPREKFSTFEVSVQFSKVMLLNDILVVDIYI